MKNSFNIGVDQTNLKPKNSTSNNRNYFENLLWNALTLIHRFVYLDWLTFCYEIAIPRTAELCLLRLKKYSP